MGPGTWGADDRRSATTGAGTSRPMAHAATPKALETLKRPNKGSATGWLWPADTSVKRAPFALTLMARAVTSAAVDSGWSENVIRRGGLGNRAHAASSALMTATPVSDR